MDIEGLSDELIVGVTVCVAVCDNVCEAVAVADEVCELLGLRLADRVADDVAVADADADGVGDGDGGSVSRAIRDTPENSIFISLVHLINIDCPLLLTVPRADAARFPDAAKICRALSVAPSYIFTKSKFSSDIN